MSSDTSQYIIFEAGNTTASLSFFSEGTGTYFIDNISVKQIPGNHILQSSAAAEPEYNTDDSIRWLSFDGVDDTIGADMDLSSLSDCSIFYAKDEGSGWVVVEEANVDLSAATNFSIGFGTSYDFTKMGPDLIIIPTANLQAGWSDTIKRYMRTSVGLPEIPAIVMPVTAGIEADNLWKLRTLDDTDAQAVIDGLAAIATAQGNATINGQPARINDMCSWAYVGQAVKTAWDGATDPDGPTFANLFNAFVAENADKWTYWYTAEETFNFFASNVIRGRMSALGMSATRFIQHFTVLFRNGNEAWIDTALTDPGLVEGDPSTAGSLVKIVRDALDAAKAEYDGDGGLYTPQFNIINELFLDGGMRAPGATDPQTVWQSAANTVYPKSGNVDDAWQSMMDLLEMIFEQADAAGYSASEMHIADFGLTEGVCDHPADLDASTPNDDATNGDQITLARNTPQGKWNYMLDTLVELAVRGHPQAKLAFQNHLNAKNFTSDRMMKWRLLTLNRQGIVPLGQEGNLQDTGTAAMSAYIQNNFADSDDRWRIHSAVSAWRTVKSMLTWSKMDTYCGWTDAAATGANTAQPMIGKEFRAADSGTEKVFPMWLGVHTAFRHADPPASRVLPNVFYMSLQQTLGPRYTVSSTAPVLDVSSVGVRNTTTTGTLRYKLDRFLIRDGVANDDDPTNIGYFMIWEAHSAPASDWNAFDLYTSTSDRIQVQVAAAGNLKVYGKAGGTNNPTQSVGTPSSTNWNCLMIVPDGSTGAKLCLNGATPIAYTFTAGMPSLSGSSSFCVLNHYAGTGGGWANGPRIKAIGVVDASELTSDALIQSWCDDLRAESYCDGDPAELGIYVNS